MGSLLHDRYWWANQGIVLGIGVGFLLIYVIDKLYQKDSPWWPLIPGGIMVIIGIPKTEEVLRFVGDNWALILIAIGLLVLIGAFRSRGEPQVPPVQPAAPAAPPSPAPPAEPEDLVEPKVE